VLSFLTLTKILPAGSLLIEAVSAKRIEFSKFLPGIEKLKQKNPVDPVNPV
jgi:hypothetical protein